MVLWGHSICLVGGYVIYQSQLFLLLCCYTTLLCMHYIIDAICICAIWWSHHMTSLGKHYKRGFQFLVYHRECWLWTEYVCYSVCLRVFSSEFNFKFVLHIVSSTLLPCYMLLDMIVNKLRSQLELYVSYLCLSFEFNPTPSCIERAEYDKFDRRLFQLEFHWFNT